MSKVLEGRAVIVFGAGSCAPGWSNGRAASVAYARAGAKIVAVDKFHTRAEETAALIRGEGGECLAIEADVTSKDAVAVAVRETLDAFGAIDVLHNNVGIHNLDGRMDLDEAHWDAIVDTNLKSLYLTCSEVLPHMIGRKRGVITNISSIASIQAVTVHIAASGDDPQAMRSVIAYAASKAGLNQFTQTLAVVYARQGIRANAILPGNIDTPRIRSYAHLTAAYGGEEKMIEARHAMSLTGRMGDAWDIANASVFLATDQAKYINGVLLPVDGGMACT